MHDQEIAEAGRFTKGTRRAVVVNLVRLAHRPGGVVVPADAGGLRDAESERIEHGRDDVREARHLGHGAGLHLVVRADLVVVLVVKFAAARPLAGVRAGGGVPAGRGVVLEGVGAVAVIRRFQQVAGADAEIELIRVVRIGRHLIAELIPGPVADAQNEVAGAVERDGAEHRLRVLHAVVRSGIEGAVDVLKRRAPRSEVVAAGEAVAPRIIQGEAIDRRALVDDGAVAPLTRGGVVGVDVSAQIAPILCALGRVHHADVDEAVVELDGEGAEVAAIRPGLIAGRIPRSRDQN